MAGASPSSGGSFKYDVFINFRGEDTRRCFVCHLYKALNQKALDTFIDSEKLRKGEDLSLLLKAIKESRLSIVVFSQNYASSTWCLKELVQIVECIDRQRQIVVPVFYEVDPSHVRKLKDSFSNLGKEELETWKSCLTRVVDISGYDSKNYQDDNKLIEDIVEDILEKLIRITPSSKTDGLIGMDSHMDELGSLLQLGVDDCRIVGIWGMGGIGKTTIAKAVFKKYGPQYEHKCFLDNVKEGFLTKNGAVQMVEDLLCAILNVKDRRTLVGGLDVMRERLRKKKVLLVLDDVDALDQIETLIGENPSFGVGSRIIITTRDKKLLTGFLVYEPNLFTTEKALELFRGYALRTIKLSKSYNEISRRAVEYAHGLPLALKVLGALLDNKTVYEWEYELKKIEKISISFLNDNKIGRVLLASYNGLDERHKDIFLDIACFFRGQQKDDVTQFHESCGFYPQTGLRVLEERSLVTVSGYGELMMHDLIQEMGREIVRQECTKDPRKRSRLWYYEDVLQVLSQNTPTEAVEGIILDLAKLNELCVSNEAFVGMKRLRLLQLTYCSYINCYRAATCKQQVSGDLKFLSNELRVLEWQGCPLKSLPYDFQPKNLIKIDMCGSHIEQLWEGAKPLPNLVHMDLRGSKYLIKTPDLTEATNLKELHLAGCTSLSEVHPSISALESLVELNLQGCSSLKKFPNISGNMKELKQVSLSETAITEMPSSVSDLPGLECLFLDRCRELRRLPSSIHMKSLTTLNLSCCSKLEEFPDISQVMAELSKLKLEGTAIKELPSSIKNLTRLKYLSMRNCTSLVSLPDEICDLACLDYLNLTGCSKLEKFPEISQEMAKLKVLNLEGTTIKELPSSIKNLTGLQSLSMSNCTSLVSLPDEICDLALLEYLHLYWCSKLEEFPSSIHMKSLRSLVLFGCLKLEEFPDISQVMAELLELRLDGTAIKELPSSIKNLTGLQSLRMSNCTSLVSLPDEIYDLACLDYLDLTGCSKLEKFPEISQEMAKLRVLNLEGTTIKELPSSIKNLTGLQSLSMRNCTSLVSLPDEICDLALLDNLDLRGCSKLEKLPDNCELLLAGSGIKQLPFGILRMESLSCQGWKELTTPFSSWPTCMTNPSSSVLVRLDLSDCNLLEISDAIAHLSSLTELYLSGNSNLKSLPEAMNRLGHLRKLNLKGCEGLKSIPELSSSIQYIDADNCSSLETVSTPQLPCVGRICFTFLNCLKLVNTNLFMDIVEAAADKQGEDSDYDFDLDDVMPRHYCMSLPGSEIPDWFNHQGRGSSVTVQLPPDWSIDMCEGFAICAIITNVRVPNYWYGLVCCATFIANEPEFNFKIGVTEVPLESNHMILGYINISNVGNWPSGRKYTQATFRIVENYFTFSPRYPKTREDCSWITSCGVHLLHKNPAVTVDLICTMENRETEVSRKRKRETLEADEETMEEEVLLSGCSLSGEREVEGVAGLESEEADVSGEGGLLTLSL